MNPLLASPSRPMSMDFLLLVHIFLAFFDFAHAVDPLVDVGNARYLGTPLQNGVSEWLGIRFAAPPLGDLRFKAPVDPPFEKDTQNASAHGPICLATGDPFPTAGQSEDCLFLDIFAPSGATPSSRLPVYFFIQGGGFNANGNANFNGSGLVLAADMDIVVVTFNYRVGPYGFLASEVIRQDGSLNAGLLDQRKALVWVQQHILKFGGNPKHVVLGGDSAGAQSITLHLTAFNGKPTNLFHGAIAESQSFPTQLTVKQAEFQFTALAQRVGCSNSNRTASLECLRSTDISTLQNANINIPFPGRPRTPNFLYSPVIDGTLLPDFTFNLFSQGKFLRIPLAFGDVTNEGTIFTPSNISTVEDMDSFLADNFPALTPSMARTINQFYPKSTQFPSRGVFFSAAANAYGDMRYTCPGIFVSTVIHQFMGPKPNFLYHYNVIDLIQASQGLGVPHVVELNAVWGPDNTNGAAPDSYKTTNAPIVPVVQGYWTSFIRTFDPNSHRAPGSPIWKPFSSSQRRILFETNATRMETVPDDQASRCSVLHSFGGILQQ